MTKQGLECCENSQSQNNIKTCAYRIEGMTDILESPVPDNEIDKMSRFV